ncbi:MAG: lmo0937 family membrane protein [Blastocatellales bacterium]
MLWTIVGILLILWFYGLISGIAGNLIHLLLVITVAVLMFYAATS